MSRLPERDVRRHGPVVLVVPSQAELRQGQWRRIGKIGGACAILTLGIALILTPWLKPDAFAAAHGKADSDKYGVRTAKSGPFAESLEPSRRKPAEFVDLPRPALQLRLDDSVELTAR